jgi:hypothetical protein
MRVRIFLIVCLALLVPSMARAQINPTGTISTAGADCSTSTNCVGWSVDDKDFATFGVYLDVGTSGTFVYEGSQNATATNNGTWVGVNDGAAAANATADGAYYFTNKGFRRFRFRASAINGAATVSVARGFGGGSQTSAAGAGDASQASQTDQTALLTTIDADTSILAGAFGTAGTADSQVMTVQGVTSMTPLLATVTATDLDVQIGGSDTVAVSHAALTELAAAINTNLVDVNIVSGSGSGGTALADDADFTAGTTSFTPAGGFYQSTVTACTDGDTCALGITAQRTAKVTLFSAAGAELTPSDWTIGTAVGTAGPGALRVYADFDGSALPTVANVDTEGEAVPAAASITGVSYVMVVNEDGSLERGTTTTPFVVDLGTNNDVTVTGTPTVTIASTADPCSGAKLFLPFSQAASAQLITGTASNRTYICSILIRQPSTSTQTFALVSGTGTVCATSTGALTGATTAANDNDLPFVLGSGVATVAKSDTDADNICLLQSTTDRINGVISYVVAAN